MLVAGKDVTGGPWPSPGHEGTTQPRGQSDVVSRSHRSLHTLPFTLWGTDPHFPVRPAFLPLAFFLTGSLFPKYLPLPCC